MSEKILFFLACTLAVLAIAGIVYQIAATVLVRRFACQKRPKPVQRFSASLLKPLHGAEPGLADNLASFCRQDYPDYQILFAAHDASDGALAAVEEVRKGYPNVDGLICVVPEPALGNPKVASLGAMLAQARGDMVVISDADVRVDPDYLDDLAAALAVPGVGLATCLYLGRPQDDPWSRLGALGINHGFLPSALVARAIGREDGCFGATIALRREVLDRVGGFEGLRGVLADDWVLGALVRQAGLRIALVPRPVDILVHEMGLRGLFAHELRWGRTIAMLDRPSYIGSVITQPVILALLAVLAGGFSFVTLFAAALFVRIAAIRLQERAWKLEPASFLLVILRELLSFAVFIAACGGRSVSWRGRRYRIRRDGMMEKLEDAAP